MELKTSPKLQNLTMFFNMSTKIGTKMVSPYFGTLVSIYTTFNFVPFRVSSRVEDYREAYVLVKSSKCRTIIAGFIQLIIFLSNVAWAGFNIVKYTRAENSIPSTFFLVCQMANIIAVLLFQNILWRKQEDLERFIRITCIDSNESYWKPKILTLLICFSMSLPPLHYAFIANKGEMELHNFHSFLGNLFSPNANTLGLDPELVPPPPPENWRLSNNICWLVERFIFFCILAVQHNIMPFLMILSLTMKAFVMEEFSANIRASYGNLGKIIENYEKIRELTFLNESIFGGTLLAFYITMLAFMAVVPQILMSTDVDLIEQLFTLPYILFCCLIMTNAANANTMAESSLRECIRHHQWKAKCGTDEKYQLLALSHDMDMEPVGLSCGYFTITRKVLSSIFGLFVTYGTIVFQMRNTGHTFWRI